MIRIIQLIEMIKRTASTIQVALNSDQSKVFGLKVGLAAEKSGMLQDVRWAITEDTADTLKLSSA